MAVWTRSDRINFQPIEDGHDPEIAFAVRYILEQLGIEIEVTGVDSLDNILEPYFATGLPTTVVFSTLVRKTLKNVSPYEEPDETLIKWIEHEEKLFKRLEHLLVSRRLEEVFGSTGIMDVEGFVKFSLSVHNRRKSRIGYALENHLEEIFKARNLTYSRTQITEYKSKPDFIFREIECYRYSNFPVSRLTMLGVKSTCKDRWRQVLVEANRIQHKHLLTLEPGISENQTDEMHATSLQLVLPQVLHGTYKPKQQLWLMNLRSFLDMEAERQNQ